MSMSGTSACIQVKFYKSSIPPNLQIPISPIFKYQRNNRETCGILKIRGFWCREARASLLRVWGLSHLIDGPFLVFNISSMVWRSIAALGGKNLRKNLHTDQTIFKGMTFIKQITWNNLRTIFFGTE